MTTEGRGLRNSPNPIDAGNPTSSVDSGKVRTAFPYVALNPGAVSAACTIALGQLRRKRSAILLCTTKKWPCRSRTAMPGKRPPMTRSS